MVDDLKVIKKKYGEKMSRFCRESFPIILEKNGVLSKLLLDHFHESHDLYDDLVSNNKLYEFKDFIYTLYDEKRIEEYIEVTKTPEELMNEAGYYLYECKTEEEIQKFRKYYVKGEELCTFNGNRLNTNRVFFAVKKNVDEIKRENFPKPEREDLYGTSVISIQFTKDGRNYLSIKNRYNHTVVNPDATFQNNLDNIIEGLTESFEKYYGIKQQTKSNDFEIFDYVMANDGKYYKYNYEINNVYYCPDNIIIDNYKVKNFPKEKYIILDYFVLDLINKKLSSYDNTNFDSFKDTINNIEKINIKKNNNIKEITIQQKDGNIATIYLNKQNCIIKYVNNYVDKIGDNFLYYNECLEELELNNVSLIKDDFLFENQTLQKIELNNAKIIGDTFLNRNEIMDNLNLENVEQIGHCFITNGKLVKFSAPKLKRVGGFFQGHNDCLVEMDTPLLKEHGWGFLQNNEKFKNYFVEKPSKQKQLTLK